MSNGSPVVTSLRLCGDGRKIGLSGGQVHRLSVDEFVAELFRGWVRVWFMRSTGEDIAKLGMSA